MPKFFKRGSFGRMLETDDWDREATEVRLEPDEYKEMCQKLDSQRARISGLNAQLNNTKRLLEQAQQQLWQTEAENNRLNAEKNKAQAALTQQQALNAGLLRISRERAERGARPDAEKGAVGVCGAQLDAGG